VTDPEPGSLAWERARARKRLDERSREDRLRRQSLRVLERRWDATAETLIERIGELYPKMPPEGRAELLAYTLRVQITERPRVATEDLTATPRAAESQPECAPEPAGQETTTDDQTPEEIVMVRSNEPESPPKEAPVPELGAMYRVASEVRAAITATVRDHLRSHPTATAQELISSVVEHHSVSITVDQAKYLRRKVETWGDLVPPDAEPAASWSPADPESVFVKPVELGQFFEAATNDAGEAFLQVDKLDSIGSGPGQVVAGQIIDGETLAGEASGIASPRFPGGPLDRQRRISTELKKRTSPLTGNWFVNLRVSGLTRGEVRQVEDLLDAFHAEREAARG
jgi:hypothetical protein